MGQLMERPLTGALNAVGYYTQPTHDLVNEFFVHTHVGHHIVSRLNAGRTNGMQRNREQ